MSIEVCVNCAHRVDLDYNCEDMRYIEDIGALCLECYEATMEDFKPNDFQMYNYQEQMGYDHEM